MSRVARADGGPRPGLRPHFCSHGAPSPCGVRSRAPGAPTERGGYNEPLTTSIRSDFPPSTEPAARSWPPGRPSREELSSGKNRRLSLRLARADGGPRRGIRPHFCRHGAPSPCGVRSRAPRRPDGAGRRQRALDHVDSLGFCRPPPSRRLGPSHPRAHWRKLSSDKNRRLPLRLARADGGSRRGIRPHVCRHGAPSPCGVRSRAPRRPDGAGRLQRALDHVDSLGFSGPPPSQRFGLGRRALVEGELSFLQVRTAPHVPGGSSRQKPLISRSRYSTVTLLARLRGLSTSQPRSTAMW